MNTFKKLAIISAGFLLPLISLFAAGPAASGTILINEVASTGPYDYIELYNTTDKSLELGPEWSLSDKKEGLFDTDRDIFIPTGTVIKGHGYLVIAPYKKSGFFAEKPVEIPKTAISGNTFALGSSDEAILYYRGEIEDSISWESDVYALGRREDGAEEITTFLVPSPGKRNDEEVFFIGNSPLLLNEVCSRGLDYIELINVTDTAIEIKKGEWWVEDSQKGDRVEIPEGTVIQPGALLVIYPDVLRLPFSAPKGAIASVKGSRFGLGNSDSVYLRYYGVIADSFTWSEHVTSMGRIPDGSEVIDLDLFLTPGKANRN